MKVVLDLSSNAVDAVCQVESLWELLCPLLRTALSNITIETYADWGTCIATACVSLVDLHLKSLPIYSFFLNYTSVSGFGRRAETHANYTDFLRC